MPLFRALIENGEDVISLVNVTGELLYVSASCARVLGYLPGELVSRDVFDLIHPDDLEESRAAFLDVITKPLLRSHVESRFRQKNGAWRWMESSMSNLLDERGVAAIVISSREFNDRRAPKGQPSEEAPEHARVPSQIEDFAYAVSHDLREPLRTISMFSDLLTREPHTGDRSKQFAELIIDGVTRMFALLDGLHSLAIRGCDDLPRPVDLGHVVTDVLQDLRYAITTSKAVITVDPMPMVKGDSKQLLRVFQNLIVNAIKYRGSAPIEIHVAAERMGPAWIVKVKDNGIGIAPDQHELVFDLLKRLHGPEIPGVGLGLAICRKIIKALGGVIWVESALGMGSTFCFTITGASAEEVGAGIPYLNGAKANGREHLQPHEISPPRHSEVN